jgi:hypothetical protein
MTTNPPLAARAMAPAAPQPGAQPPVKKTKGIDLDVGFDDLIDVVNPLQHLPVISAVYRELTGDAIGLGARIGGGYLYGGPIGAASAAAMAAFEAVSGDTAIGHATALMKDARPPVTATASADLPWMKKGHIPAAVATAAPAAPGSPAALSQALGKAKGPAGAAMESVATADSVALRPQLVPELAAQYYRLNATRADKGQSVRL